MSENDANPEVTQSRKILRILENFGKDEAFRNDNILASNRDLRQEEKIVDIFTEEGFTIVRGGQFQDANFSEFGIHSQPQSDDELRRHKELVTGLSIDTPRVYQPKELLKINAPIIVKALGVDRGEGKYLLETLEQKVKFLLWSMIGSKLPELYYNPQREKLFESLINKIKAGNWRDIFFKQSTLGCFHFEEFVLVPGRYFSSFRIVADGLGDIQYGQVTRSADTQDNASTLIQESKVYHSEYQYDPWEAITIPGIPFEVLLTDPRSLFFLNSKKFVSNIAAGGSRILLNGKNVTNDFDRELLITLGIDPDNPQIPEELKRVSRQIGRRSRGDYPYVGIDYLKRRTGNVFVFLEANIRPNLTPEALDLPPLTTPEDCDLEMMKRVAKKS